MCQTHINLKTLKYHSFAHFAILSHEHASCHVVHGVSELCQRKEGTARLSVIQQNPLTAEEIRKSLSTTFFGRKAYVFQSLDSTNAFAKSLRTQDEPEGTLIVTREQTSGRGRFGREWLSTPGQNLTFSLILKPTVPLTNAGMISLCAAVGICNAINDITGIQAECKWPNDILMGGRKVCGILSELTMDQSRTYAVVMGIGMNVNQIDFPGHLSRTATSLREQTGIEYDLVRLLAAVLLSLEQTYQILQRQEYGAILEGWKGHARMLGSRVRALQGNTIIEGVAEAVREDGSLSIRTTTESVHVYAGEVTILNHS